MQLLSLGEHIIIDFKTDKVKSEKELIDRYKTQLEIYKEGVEMSRKVKVMGTYIYSFELQKLIEIQSFGYVPRDKF